MEKPVYFCIYSKDFVDELRPSYFLEVSKK